MTSDERLALAYWCLAHDSTLAIQALPAADRIAIYSHMADIRAEHGRTAAGLVGGLTQFGELLDSMTRENQQ